MNEEKVQLQSVIIERELPHLPEKVWRVLTQPDLIGQWLMKNDFSAVVDHHFTLSADWGSVECKVLKVEPYKTLTYTWAAYGLESTVTWTLTPTDSGTHMRMEHSGFRPDQPQAFNGAKYGWQKFLGELERVIIELH